jgi:hypothetical protein
MQQELQKEVTKMRDFQEIQNLQAQYGYYLSRGPWADWDGELCGLFTEDATIELSDRGIFVGKEGIKKVLGNKGLICGSRKASYMHLMLQQMPYIKVYEDGTACAVWSLFGICAGSQYPMEDNDEPAPYWQSGRYENEYRKVNGTWKISKITYRQYFATPYDKAWCKVPVIKGRRNPFIIPDKPPTEYRPYNPKATCQEEQMSEANLPSDKK